MAPPVKPTAPAQPLRSQPSTFSSRAEAAIAYQFGALPNWMESIAVFVEAERLAAEAAAAASGAAGGFDLTGKGNHFFTVNAGATATEFSTPTAARTKLGATTVGAAVFTAATAAAARTTLGAGATGAAVFQAANVTAARSALGVGGAGSPIMSANSDVEVRTLIGAQTTLGFTPVEQGGGTGMGVHKVRVGWDSERPRIDVDNGGFNAQLALRSEVPVMPGNAGGPGQWVKLAFGVAAPIVMPAGGTWAYSMLIASNTGATLDFFAGVTAGGTTVRGGIANQQSLGFAWRFQG